MDATEQSAIRNATDTLEWYEALGYLSTWNMTFPICNIYLDGKTDMIAVYRNADNTHGYTIGAIWHTDDNKYTFHS